jgi:hypothetical protein
MGCLAHVAYSFDQKKGQATEYEKCKGKKYLYRRLHMEITLGFVLL